MEQAQDVEVKRCPNLSKNCPKSDSCFYLKIDGLKIAEKVTIDLGFFRMKYCHQELS